MQLGWLAVKTNTGQYRLSTNYVFVWKQQQFVGMLAVDPRYFWRRAFAFLGDLLLAGLFFGILVFIVDVAVPIKIVAPEVPKYSNCYDPPNPLSNETMNHIIPLKEGQSHFQIQCQQTNGFLTSYYRTILGKRWREDNTNYNVSVRYPSNRNGSPVSILYTDPIFPFLAPFVLALLLSRFGTTPAKRLLSLTVVRDNKANPGLTNCLIREYLKFSPLMVFAGLSLPNIYQHSNYTDKDAFHDSLKALASGLETTVSSEGFFGAYWALSFVVFLLFFGFYFGSFIFWRGQTFWDRFARLYTIGPDDNGEASGNAEA